VQYRPDIDGLRGIAVIAVMLFHFGVPGFTGGFSGVDVFFVISGYLITTLIQTEIAAGRFSFAAFYERRIRRLFPALLTVVALSSIAGVILFEPHDLRDLRQSVVATVLFAANFLFWQTTGYFDPAADVRPLLHTWSLSVEEQFYIVFPVFLLLAVRYLPRQAHWLIVAVALASFAASAALTAAHPSAAFYLLLFRAWELLIGAWLALRPAPAPLPAAWREAAAALGLVLIGYGVFAFSRNTPFPGTSALAPCAGTALLIVAGMNGGSSVNRLLSLRPIVFAGLISYSLYLWHWPLLVFAKYYLIRELTAPEKIALLAASFALAAASWRYIELPFRGSRGLLSRTALFRTAGVISLLLIATGSTGFNVPGTQQTPPDAAARTLPHQHCLNRDVSKIAGGDLCRLGAASPARPTFLLWGDSHAGALAPAIERAAKDAGRAGWFAGQAGCLPFPGVERRDRNDLRCGEFNDAVAKLLEQNGEIRTVFLVARWAMYTEGMRTEDASGAMVLIGTGKVADNARAFREGFERTLRTLAGRNLDVVFVTQAPDIGWDVPAVVARSRSFGRRVPEPPSLETHRARQKQVTDILQDLSGRYPLRVVDLARALCPRGTCLIERSGQLLYLDSNHLNAHGNEFVAGAFAGVM
jgi:peptidoglycan/LPS O-acetylase OafA/YrhL